jgi:hypothetical protein
MRVAVRANAPLNAPCAAPSNRSAAFRGLRERLGAVR